MSLVENKDLDSLFVGGLNAMIHRNWIFTSQRIVFSLILSSESYQGILEKVVNIITRAENTLCKSKITFTAKNKYLPKRLKV
jgi:hypothetical protein